MASPLNIKTEGLVFPTAGSPVDWSSSASSSSTSSSPPKFSLQPYFSHYPEVPVAKTVRDSRKFDETPFNFNCSKLEAIPPVPQNDVAVLHSPSGPIATDFEEEISPSEVVERVPRPPNAFMLFRSDFLKLGTIPKSVEKRQQALSRVAGEVWGLMPTNEKEKWHALAAEKQREHKEKYPNYKFVPSPRGSRRNKDKVQTVTDTAATAQDRTQQLREKYTKFIGPCPVSSRKRRPKSNRGVGASTSSVHPMHHSLPNTPMCSPPSSPSKGIDSDSLFYPGGQLRMPRRPSTSLGLTQCPVTQQASSSLGATEVKRAGFDFGSVHEQEMFANFEPSENWAAMDHTMVVPSVQNPIYPQFSGYAPVQPVDTAVPAYGVCTQFSSLEESTKSFAFRTATVVDASAVDPLCDPNFLDAMSLNQDFLSMPFVDNNTFAMQSLPQDHQIPQNSWSRPIFTNPFASQPNDGLSGFNFN